MESYESYKAKQGLTGREIYGFKVINRRISISIDNFNLRYVNTYGMLKGCKYIKSVKLGGTDINQLDWEQKGRLFGNSI